MSHLKKNLILLLLTEIVISSEVIDVLSYFIICWCTFFFYTWKHFLLQENVSIFNIDSSGFWWKTGSSLNFKC